MTNAQVHGVLDIRQCWLLHRCLFRQHLCLQAPEKDMEAKYARKMLGRPGSLHILCGFQYDL